MSKAANGAILYQGPSQIDGAPIVCIVTGLAHRSANSKTGDELQTWILRTDFSPKEAVLNGADSAICGDCVMRLDSNGHRRCYVKLWGAPRSVWAKFNRGEYGFISEGAMTGRTLRLGSYGDPAAVPFAVWQVALTGTVNHTGYTHQWRGPQFAQFKEIVMASCDLAMDVRAAYKLGWRSFYVVPKGGDPTGTVQGAMVCPASAERGHKTTCERCHACDGTGGKNRRNVVINEHR